MAHVQGYFQIPEISLREQEVRRCYCYNSSKMAVVGFGLLLPVIKQMLSKVKKQNPCEMDRRKHSVWMFHFGNPCSSYGHLFGEVAFDCCICWESY